MNVCENSLFWEKSHFDGFLRYEVCSLYVSEILSIPVWKLSPSEWELHILPLNLIGTGKPVRVTSLLDWPVGGQSLARHPVKSLRARRRGKRGVNGGILS